MATFVGYTQDLKLQLVWGSPSIGTKDVTVYLGEGYSTTATYRTGLALKGAPSFETVVRGLETIASSEGIELVQEPGCVLLLGKRGTGMPDVIAAAEAYAVLKSVIRPGMGETPVHSRDGLYARIQNLYDSGRP